MENYGLSITEASKLNSYKFIQKITIEEIKEKVKTGTMPFADYPRIGKVEYCNYQPIELTFGYLECVLLMSKINSKVVLHYLVTGKDWEGWITSEEIDENVNLDISDIEMYMFYKMLKYGKENKLTWSRPNYGNWEELVEWQN